MNPCDYQRLNQFKKNGKGDDLQLNLTFGMVVLIVTMHERVFLKAHHPGSVKIWNLPVGHVSADWMADIFNFVVPVLLGSIPLLLDGCPGAVS